MQIEMVGDKVVINTDSGLQLIGQNARRDLDKPNYRFILKDQFLRLEDYVIWSAIRHFELCVAHKKSETKIRLAFNPVLPMFFGVTLPMV